MVIIIAITFTIHDFMVVEGSYVLFHDDYDIVLIFGA